MARNNMQWFRFYHGAADDRKIKRIARQTGQSVAEVLGIWTIILSIASKSPIRGELWISEGLPFEIEDIEDMAGCNVSETLQKLHETDMVTLCNANDVSFYSVNNWNKRQYKSDNSTERVQRHRKRKKELDTIQNVTKTLTIKEENETELKRYSNVTVTASESESESESESDSSSKKALPSEPEPEGLTFSHVWTQYREIFKETFGQYPSKDYETDISGDIRKLAEKGLDEVQATEAIFQSLDNFVPTDHNPRPKTWRYCLPAMWRKIEKPARKHNNNSVVTVTQEEMDITTYRQEVYERMLADGVNPNEAYATALEAMPA